MSYNRGTVKYEINHTGAPLYSEVVTPRLAEANCFRKLSVNTLHDNNAILIFISTFPLKMKIFLFSLL